MRDWTANYFSTPALDAWQRAQTEEITLAEAAFLNEVKHELIDVVWSGSCVSGATLSQCVMELRRALSDAAHEPRFLRTVRGRGYRFIATVTA